jgi:hypothetical protein
MHHRQHFPDRFLIQQRTLVAARRPLDGDRESGEVRGGCPQTRRGELGVDVAVVVSPDTVPVGLRRVLRPISRQRLVKGAVRHTGGAEYHLLHQLRERLAHDVDEHLLDDRRTAAGVTICLTRRDIDANGHRVGRTAAVEDLLQGRHSIPGFVSREAVHRRPTRVTQEHPQRDRRGASELVPGQLP